MGIKVSDVENDPLVQGTFKIISDAVREAWKDQEFRPDPDAFLRIDTASNPMFRLLEEADCLDSVAAATLVAERFAGMVDFSQVAPKLDKDVAEALQSLRACDDVESPAEILSIKNPVARNITFAGVTGMLTGEEFKEMKAEAASLELSMIVGQIGTVFADIGESIIEKKGWEALPPKLMDKYLEGMQNLCELTTSKSARRVMKGVLDELKEEMARAAAAEVTAPAPQPVRIDPASPFAQLKGAAKKFRPQA